MTDNWAIATNGDWAIAGNWTSGVPTSATDAVIGGVGGYTVTLNGESGQANSLTIFDPSAKLNINTFGGTQASLAILGDFGNSGTLYVDAVPEDGGSALTIGGKLTNSNLVMIGNGNNQSATTTVTAADLDNTGTIDLAGAATTNQVTLNISAGVLPSILTATDSLIGDALLEFASGGVTSIASGGSLTVNGVKARVADASITNGNSALTGLASNDGMVSEIANANGSYADTPTTLASFYIADGENPHAGLIASGAGNLIGTTNTGGASDVGTTSPTPTLTTLVDINGPNGETPDSILIADAAGDLFGVIGTPAGGANGTGDGAVFEIHAGTATTLVTLSGSPDGLRPYAVLITDAAGDLFGTTYNGGANNDGMVFEIAKTSGSYASAPTTLASFNIADGENPYGGLIADANGNLIGTTAAGGDNLVGTVFEIPFINGSYGSTPITLVSFSGAFAGSNGAFPYGNLIADAAGDLSGTTQQGGANNRGTVFELVNNGGSYASTPTTLVSFDGTNGAGPMAGLIADAAGDLFGTTEEGGANNAGTVFELVRNGGGSYTFTTLVSFNGTDGANPEGVLIEDAAGNLFGTTNLGGTSLGLASGTVFEIAKTGGAYSSTPITLVNFNGTNGRNPDAGLVADGAGDLFGTTTGGGANGDGTVFEVTDSGFTVSFSAAGTLQIDELATNPGGVQTQEFNAPITGLIDGDKIRIATAHLGNFAGIDAATPGAFNSGSDTTPLVLTSGGATVATLTLDGNYQGDAFGVSAPSGGFMTIGMQLSPDDFSGIGQSDILWRNTSGEVDVWNSKPDSGGLSFAPQDLGPVTTDWGVSGTGDFNGDGRTDILWRNTNGEVDLWDSTSGNTASFTYQDLGAVTTDWTVAATKDFNGDGKADILWRNTDGDVELWNSISGSTVSFSYQDFGVVTTDWSVAATGDFNGDGKADILWRNTNGDLYLWDSNPGNGVSFSYQDLGIVPTAWSVAATGDFNGDGKTDILWRNANGEVDLWDSNPGSTVSFSFQDLGNVATAWNIIGTGDFNGEGKSDILWQYENSANPSDPNNGEAAVWLMNGATLTSATVIGQPPSSWHIVT